MGEPEDEVLQTADPGGGRLLERHQVVHLSTAHQIDGHHRSTRSRTPPRDQIQSDLIRILPQRGERRDQWKHVYNERGRDRENMKKKIHK